MPSSQHYHISKIMSLIITLNPNSILDIGTGFGKYGMLCREYLELWDGRKKYSEFLRRIDGIEAFEEYITPVHRFVYNNIYAEDALKILDKVDFKYDLILLIDVLEHFDKSTGRSFLEKMLQLHGGVLVSTPKKVSNQTDAFGNEFERHRSQWTKAELVEMGKGLWISDRISHISYLTRKENQIKLLKKRMFVRRIASRRGGRLLTKLLNHLG